MLGLDGERFGVEREDGRTDGRTPQGRSAGGAGCETGRTRHLPSHACTPWLKRELDGWDGEADRS